MTDTADRPAPRVRPHVARVVGLARYVLLDFDGVMFDVQAAMRLDATEQAISDLLLSREHGPLPVPITFAWYGAYTTLAFLAENEPDLAVEAEELMSGLELDASLTARPAHGLGRLLDVCVSAGCKVAVISDMSERAVLVALQAHALTARVNAVAARQGLDVDADDAGCTAQRAADLLGASLASCLVVSGSERRLRSAQRIGAMGLGCECGRDPRKHLADAQTPVVSSLATLSEALLTR